MKRKIIQILCHTLENDSKLGYHVRGNWSARQARNILAYSNKYACEAWYAVRNLKKEKKIVENGITYRLFPAHTFNALFESFYPIVSCPPLFNALAKEDPKRIIVHFQGERGNLIYTLLRKLPHLKVTIQFHGYGQPKWLDWLEKLVLTPQEKNLFPRVSHFFVHIRRRINYLENIINIPRSKIDFQNNGIDFDKFKPGSLIKARQDLKIPKDAFVILYVGVMTKTKGVDAIISAVQILKKKYPQLYLILVGAAKSDPLYKQASKYADKLVHVVDNSLLPSYYHASNTYVFFGSEKTIEYAGVGTAPTEALASNINVISTNLIHLPDSVVDTAGFVPKDFDDFVKKIEYLIKHPKFVFNARNKVYPYTSYRHTTNSILRVYDEIFSKNS